MREPRRRPLRPSLVVAAVAAFAATGAVSAGCSSDSDDDQYVNCVDEQGQVVDPDLCDDDDGTDYHGYHGGYYYLMSPKRYKVGSKAPSDWRSKSINPSDAGARIRAGLPSTGKVGGTTVRSGGFGSGKGGGS